MNAKETKETDEGNNNKINVLRLFQNTRQPPDRQTCTKNQLTCTKIILSYSITAATL